MVGIVPNVATDGLIRNIKSTSFWFSSRWVTYEAERRKHPKGWSRHLTNWQQPEIAKINHPRPIELIEAR